MASSAPIRSVIVRVTIGSFSLAALMGVIALLGGGDFGETQGRVLLTTLLVGVVSIAVLCYLATGGTPWQAVGVAGGMVVLVPLVTALSMIWGSLDGSPSEALVKSFGVGAIVAGTLAQASLLLALAGRGTALNRGILLATLVLAAALAGLTSALVLGLSSDHDWFFRLLGIVAILDVLGTVVVAALSRFGGGGNPHASGVVELPAGLVVRLDALAGGTGQQRADLVALAVERYLAERERERGPSS